MSTEQQRQRAQRSTHPPTTFYAENDVAGDIERHFQEGVWFWQQDFASRGSCSHGCDDGRMRSVLNFPVSVSIDHIVLHGIAGLIRCIHSQVHRKDTHNTMQSHRLRLRDRSCLPCLLSCSCKLRATLSDPRRPRGGHEARHGQILLRCRYAGGAFGICHICGEVSTRASGAPYGDGRQYGQKVLTASACMAESKGFGFIY